MSWVQGLERGWRRLAVLAGAVLLSQASAGQNLSAPVVTSLWAAPMAGAQSATKVPSTVTLTVTTPPIVFYGEAIDGVAQVTANDGSTATGTVTFFDGTTSFCTLALNDGASCPAGSATGFAAGAHAFMAVYSGDTTHAGATSNVVTVTVTQDTTTTTLASSANPVAAGGGVVYTATVAGAHGPASGSVTFLDGAVAMGSAAVDGSGTATLTAFMMMAGTHALTAVYVGSADSAGSTSAVLREVVNEAGGAGGFTLGADEITVSAGASAAVPVKVTGGAGLVKSLNISCKGLPDAASCELVASGGTAALKISTAAPRDCGSSVPYGASSRRAQLPLAAPVLAGLLVMFVPGPKRVMKTLLVVIFAVVALNAMTGCGMGNCTDLGTRPGTYMITVTGGSGGTVASEKLKLVVKP